MQVGLFFGNLVREQKQKIATAQNNAKTAEAEIVLIQQSCSHAWQYMYTSIVSRTDSDLLHQWIMHVRCDKCEAEENRYLFAPPCRIHMKAMKREKTLEHLPPQEGHRNRHIFKNEFKCTIPECNQTEVWELKGGEG